MPDQREERLWIVTRLTGLMHKWVDSLNGCHHLHTTPWIILRITHSRLDNDTPVIHTLHKQTYTTSLYS